MENIPGMINTKKILSGSILKGPMEAYKLLLMHFCVTLRGGVQSFGKIRYL